MKSLLLFALLAFATCNSFLPTKPLGLPSQQDLVDFLIGGLVAVKVTDDVPDGFPCVNTIGDLQADVQTAIGLIRNGSWVEGVDLVWKSINATYVACGAAASEGQAVVQAFLQKVQDPEFINLALNRIENNFKTVVDDAVKGVEDLNNGSYFSAGNDFGSILHLILSGPETRTELVNLLMTELAKLGSVNWPFTNCAASSPLQPAQMTLDATPAKGVAEGMNLVGTANAPATLKQVMIVTSLNGTPLNTQYDAFANSYQAGDSFNYRFAITIPSFAPSGKYSVTMTLQGTDGSTAACVNVGFSL
jgi:hypothetical protein